MHPEHEFSSGQPSLWALWPVSQRIWSHFLVCFVCGCFYFSSCAVQVSVDPSLTSAASSVREVSESPALLPLSRCLDSGCFPKHTVPSSSEVTRCWPCPSSLDCWGRRKEKTGRRNGGEWRAVCLHYVHPVPAPCSDSLTSTGQQTLSTPKWLLTE